MNAPYQKHREFMLNTSSWPSFHSHLHTHCEIMYVSDGILNATLDGTNYEIHKNEAIFILPHQIHSFESKRYNQGYTKFVSPLILPKHAELMRTSILENPVISLKGESTVKLCDNIVEYLFECFPCISIYENVNKVVDEEAASKSNFAKSLVESYVSLLLDGAVWKKKNTSAMSNARRVLEYCLEHYKDDISLYDVAAQFDITEHTVTRVFNGIVKCSFRTYINNLRLSDAEAKLKETNLPVTKISEVCGFETIRTFNRVFLAAYGVTPSQYRKKHKEQNISI